MDRDTTAFKQRFEAYKNGKSVSEIYDAGLPRYGDGLAPTTTYSDDDALSYIIALENPNKVGWDSNKKVWRVPTGSGFDHNAIAYGLDIREKHNPYVYNFLKSKGRLNDPWLTDSEARALAMKSYHAKDDSVAKAMGIAKGKVSERGYQILRGMAQHGDPMKKLLDEDTVTGKAFRRAIAEGDADLNTVFDAYYLHPANAKKYAERIKADAKYRPKAQFVTQDGKVLKIDWNKQVPQWQPPKLQTPHNTEYPIVNTAPESISSWSGADSPSKGPSIQSIQDTMQQQQNILNQFGLHPVTSSRSILPPLSKLMPSLDELMAEQQQDYIKDILNIENPVKDALYHAKNGKLPGYENGTGLADFIKNRLYTNVDPHDYNIPKAIFQFLGGEREYRSGMKEALWAKYLGRDTYNDYVGEKSVDDWIVPAVYSPTTGKSTYTTYRLNPAKFNNSHAGSAGGPLSDENIRAYFKRRAELGKNNFTTDDGFPNSGMGYYTMGSGQDEKGRYISYYDDWDINPFHGKTAQSWTKILPKALTDKADILQGTLGTNPYTLYDRRYLTDEEWQALGGYKNGKLPYFSDGKSPIHIKPANRGKFTALKKRTGHSASWFKKNGTPAQKKMAVFALNAKKWKH